MPRCSYCNKWMVGGLREGELRFCKERCREDGFLCTLADGIDDDYVGQIILERHARSCSICNQAGPVDVYERHDATSLIYTLDWKDSPIICCRRCGLRHIRRGIVWTIFLGWWHPLGVFTATWQLINGFKQLASLPDVNTPSSKLVRMIKLEMGKRIYARSKL